MTVGKSVDFIESQFPLLEMQISLQVYHAGETELIAHLYNAHQMVVMMNRMCLPVLWTSLVFQ
jgi:hypothetical protein